jgi:hypothetical protein
MRVVLGRDINALLRWVLLIKNTQCLRQVSHATTSPNVYSEPISAVVLYCIVAAK